MQPKQTTRMRQHSTIFRFFDISAVNKQRPEQTLKQNYNYFKVLLSVRLLCVCVDAFMCIRNACDTSNTTMHVVSRQLSQLLCIKQIEILFWYMATE